MKKNQTFTLTEIEELLTSELTELKGGYYNPCSYVCISCMKGCTSGGTF